MISGLSNVTSERLLDVDAVLARDPEAVRSDDLTALDVHGRLTLEAVPRAARGGITVLATLRSRPRAIDSRPVRMTR